MHFSTLASFTTLFAAVAFAHPTEDKAGAYVPYAGPKSYYIQNAATGTVFDLLNGNPDPNAHMNGYALNPNPHQIWQISSTGPNNEVTIINTSTGSIASCPHSVNAPNRWYQMTGGEVPLDTYALLNKIQNADNSVQFKNQATGNCMDLANSNPADGTPVLCFPCHPGVGTNQNCVLLST